jgi:hypothetical protein
MDLQQDHPSIGWGNWTDQFQDSPRLEATVRSLLQPMQGVQLTLLRMHRDRWLDTAEGAQLDGIGEIVGLARVLDNAVFSTFFGFVGQPAIGGFGEARLRRSHENHLSGSTTLGDAEYRRLLRWKIAINNGRGTAPEIVAALRTIFEVPRVIVEDAGTAAIRIWIAQPAGARNPLMANAARWVPKAAGVRISVITTSPERPFGFKNQGFDGFGVGVFAHRL